MKRLCIILSVLLLSAAAAQAQKKRAQATTPGDKTHVLLILDCSSSMWNKWQSDSKIKVTQAVLLKFMDSISHQNNVEFAMRVFGHLNKNDRGTRLEVPFEYDNNYKIKSKIKTLVPQGGCTATSALSNALNDFPQGASSRNIILIITDGLDDCGDDICQSAREVQTSGMVVKTFVIGIGDKRNFKK
ncbi:MAG: VWA domain-containing protein, partial [Bacteroidales bacterium]|nr:VWA domain-containing protein [Bacteroidales bacterium]